MTLTCRLYRPDDLEQLVPHLNRTFQVVNPPLTAGAWAGLEAGDHVTVVAEEDGRLAGAIPFDLRDLVLRPGVVVRAGIAHAVGVVEGCRGRGVGSAMMGYARRELGAHCDGLFVYADGEGAAARFYERNGFVGLHYSRMWRLWQPQGAMPAGIQAAPLDPEALDGMALDGVYQAAYGAMGGFMPRSPGYWQRQLTSIIYTQVPRALHLAWAEQDGQLAGYLVFGLRPRSALALELAVRPGAAGLAKRLLQAMIAVAAGRGAQKASMFAGDRDPAIRALRALGFQPEGRGTASAFAGQLLDPARIWPRLAAGRAAPALHLWTPERQLALPGNGPTVTLEMAETTLQRLFLCREDTAAALHAESITSPTFPLPLAELQAAFRPAQWVHHEIDWI